MEFLIVKRKVLATKKGKHPLVMVSSEVHAPSFHLVSVVVSGHCLGPPLRLHTTDNQIRAQALILCPFYSHESILKIMPLRNKHILCAYKAKMQSQLLLQWWEVLI